MHAGERKAHQKTSNSIYLFHFYKQTTFVIRNKYTNNVFYIQSVILILQNSVRKAVKVKEFRKEKFWQRLKK